MFTYKKNLGQNFLIDKNKIKQIILFFDNIKVSSKNTNVYKILEVGPGSGALTSFLDSDDKNEVIAIEIDNELIPILNEKNFKRTKIINEDFLKVDLNNIYNENDEINFISNLPYYISTKIIFNILNDLRFKTISIMMQKELGERIFSKHGNKTYGRISVAIQTFFKFEKKIVIPKTQFKPQPKVDSVFLTFTRKNNTVIEIEEYLYFIKCCFANKRKTLLNSLKNTNYSYIEKVIEFLEEEKINLKIRAEDISVEIYINIWNYIKNH